MTLEALMEHARRHGVNFDECASIARMMQPGAPESSPPPDDPGANLEMPE